METPSRFDADLPVQRIRTERDWNDLVLTPAAREQLEDVQRSLVQHASHPADAGPGRHVRAGFRCLFHGLPGSGKTLAAELLGRACVMDVYRVDLAVVVSKYIGETEKNLRRIFDAAEASDAILLFDEADALFGDRTSVGDAHDRYANVEIGYLLQRLEEHEGIVILATNSTRNIDPAFLRRFHAIVDFTPPGPDDRRRP